MNIKEALEIAMKEDKEIALPTDERCFENGYHIRIKPFSYNLQCLEFYGNKRKINEFPIRPDELIRDDWIVI